MRASMNVYQIMVFSDPTRRTLLQPQSAELWAKFVGRSSCPRKLQLRVISNEGPVEVPV